MATYIAYTPTGVIAKAMFNFDAYGGVNYKLTGTVNVSVSDSFTYLQYFLAFPQLSSDIYTSPSFSSGNGNWTAAQLANINLVTSDYSDFINLNFSAVANYSGLTPVNVGSGSDINISLIYRTDFPYSGESAGGNDTSFGYAGSRGDIVLNVNGFGFSGLANDYSLDPISFGFHTLMHEIGHSLGLSHPHSPITGDLTADYAATTAVGFDKLGFHINSPLDMNKEYFSIMSYDDQAPAGAPDTFAQTPMILDVIALQTAYGEGAGSSGTGNDVITPGAVGGVLAYRTYFDTGGIDTINLDNYGSGAYLHMGTTIVGATHLVGVSMSIADETTMISGGDPSSLRWFYGEYENAIGSSGNDWLIGNTSHNDLNGGSGNDLMTGGAGNDRFDWDGSQRAGNDTMRGGVGNDTYVISGNDQVIENAGEGIDLIWAGQTYSLVSLPNVENLSLIGTANINGTGNGGNNVLTGNSGANVLNGGAGTDTLRGSAGNDTLVWASTDNFDGGAGTDTLKVNGGNLNLTTIANTKILNVETINLTNGSNNLLTLNTQDVLALSSTTNTLKVLGNTGDSINIANGFSDLGVVGTFHKYGFGGATLLVDLDITNVA